ncbi:MAG: OmpH family outer membrane protein [Bacteroidia bacterium]|nr:OmpH family outer membrane protein [Bacteroidia bacterium]MDW8300960.1 OmpH family outer membrane protein [Bacteroidia bacterium]
MNKQIVALVVVSVTIFAAAAQPIKPLKIGYTNVDYIVSLMPEAKKVEEDLIKYKQELEATLKAKYEAYENALKSYSEGVKAGTISGPTKLQKEKDLLIMQEELGKLEKSSESQLAQKQQALLQPILDKVDKAIKEVAQENGYTYIFNSDAGAGTTPILLHGPDEGNITDLVKKKLGISK